MKLKAQLLILLFVLLPAVAFSGENITAEEIQSCLYADGEMICSGGELISSYKLEDETIIRTNVFNFKKKQSTPDHTVYQRFKGLTSDPKNNSGEHFPQVIRAISAPGNDVIETITIDNTHIHTIRSVSNYFSISRYKIVHE